MFSGSALTRSPLVASISNTVRQVNSRRSGGALKNSSAHSGVSASGCQLVSQIRKELIGDRARITTPYGEKPIVYADYTASGRAIGFLEENIQNLVLPYYANTHTEASFTGAQTNALRESARQAVRQSVNGTQDDKVIFCGSGATTAINRIIDIIGMRLPHDLVARHSLLDQIPEQERPVVFVGPYEHHSNELPWRETIADVVRIGLNAYGTIDEGELADALDRYQKRPLLIGSFSAASNVTGIRSDVESITQLLKSKGALSFWDYAAAGPYVEIDVNRPGAAIDAVFVSPHKFVGGPGTPGVLIAKSHLLNNAVPAVVGGGTVSYVSPTEHRYLENPEHREEGGTPAIVESIRAGAVFALKDRIGTDWIETTEHELVDKAFDLLDTIPEIEVLGPRHANRLGIFSMRLRYADKDLHHGFVAALLNDLFGIQARGGCSCAGPYGHDLLNIDLQRSRALDEVVANGYECFKPGWVRVNLHFATEASEIDYVLAALKLVATQGWRLLPSYHLDPQRGTWVHRDGAHALPVSLDDLLDGSQKSSPVARVDTPFSTLLAQANEIINAGSPEAHCAAALEEVVFEDGLEAQRWFATGREAAEQLSDR